jgi:hypothetical protein
MNPAYIAKIVPEFDLRIGTAIAERARVIPDFDCKVGITIASLR